RHAGGRVEVEPPIAAPAPGDRADVREASGDRSSQAAATASTGAGTPQHWFEARVEYAFSAVGTGPSAACAEPLGRETAPRAASAADEPAGDAESDAIAAASAAGIGPTARASRGQAAAAPGDGRGHSRRPRGIQAAGPPVVRPGRGARAAEDRGKRSAAGRTRLGPRRPDGGELEPERQQAEIG